MHVSTLRGTRDSLSCARTVPIDSIHSIPAQGLFEKPLTPSSLFVLLNAIVTVGVIDHELCHLIVTLCSYDG